MYAIQLNSLFRCTSRCSNFLQRQGDGQLLCVQQCDEDQYYNATTMICQNECVNGHTVGQACIANDQNNELLTQGSQVTCTEL